MINEERFSVLYSDNHASRPNNPGKFNVYLEEGHHNDTIYRCKDKDIETKLNTLTTDAVELYYLFIGTELEEFEDYKILARMLGKQRFYWVCCKCSRNI